MRRREFVAGGALSSLALAGAPAQLHRLVEGLQTSPKSTEINQLFKLSEHYDPKLARTVSLGEFTRPAPPDPNSTTPPPPAPPTPQHRILYFDRDKKVFLPPALLKDHRRVLNQAGKYKMEAFLRRYHTSTDHGSSMKQQFDAGSLQLQLGVTDVNPSESDDLTWFLITGLLLPQTQGQSVQSDNNPTSKFTDAPIEITNGVLGFSVSLWGQKKQGGWFKWLSWIAGVLKTASNFPLFGVVPIPALPKQAVQVASNALNYFQSQEKLFEIWNSLQGRYAILNSLSDDQVEGYLPSGEYILLDPNYYDDHRDIPNRKFLPNHSVDVDSGAYTLLDDQNREPDAADYLTMRLTYTKS